MNTDDGWEFFRGLMIALPISICLWGIGATIGFFLWRWVFE